MSTTRQDSTTEKNLQVERLLEIVVQLAQDSLTLQEVTIAIVGVVMESDPYNEQALQALKSVCVE